MSPCTCCQVQTLVSNKNVTKVNLILVCGYCSSKDYISVECRYSGRPSKHSLQNASQVRLGVSQAICGAAVMCGPARARPVLPFVHSTNNCRSEHIHRTLLCDVAVTRMKRQGKPTGLILVKIFILNVCLFFLLLNLKYLQILNCVSFVII